MTYQLPRTDDGEVDLAKLAERVYTYMADGYFNDARAILEEYRVTARAEERETIAQSLETMTMRAADGVHPSFDQVRDAMMMMVRNKANRARGDRQ